jgi:hypothetical protein
MNNPHLETLTQHLSNQLSGEPIPDFRSDEVAQVMAATGAILASPEFRQLSFRLGMCIMDMTIERIMAGAQATRAIAISRDNGGNLC